MFVWAFVGCLGVAVVCLSVLRFHRKREREMEYRRQEAEAQVGLPDCRNEYLRSRLETALGGRIETRLPVDLKFLHANKLLYALSEKRLSGADSLLLHKLQKEVGRYSTKQSLSVYETEEISTSLCKLLSLCAKYEV